MMEGRLEGRLIQGTVEGGGIHHRLEVGPGEMNFRSLQLLACCLSDARDYDYPHRPVTPVRPSEIAQLLY